MVAEVSNSYRRLIGRVEELVVDMSDAQLVEQPVAGMNHGAWIIGHLVCSLEAIGGEIGIEPWLASDWGDRFGTGSEPVGDGAVYPGKAILLKALADGRDRVLLQLEAMTPRDLAEPLPDVRYRDIYPTVGHAVLDILTIHAAGHVGQLGVWRRLVGAGAGSA